MPALPPPPEDPKPLSLGSKPTDELAAAVKRQGTQALRTDVAGVQVNSGGSGLAGVG
jgi:hypothetical protein